MDLKEQEKISKLLRAQAEKLGIALQALRKIDKMRYMCNNNDVSISEAFSMARRALVQIGDVDRNTQDL